MGRLDPFVVQRSRDLGEPEAAGVLQADAIHKGRGQHRSPAGSPARFGGARLLQMLTDELLQFGDRDQSLPPRRLDGADCGNDAPIDRRDADAESLGSLTAAAGKTLHIVALM